MPDLGSLVYNKTSYRSIYEEGEFPCADFLKGFHRKETLALPGAGYIQGVPVNIVYMVDSMALSCREPYHTHPH